MITILADGKGQSLLYSNFTWWRWKKLRSHYAIKYAYQDSRRRSVKNAMLYVLTGTPIRAHIQPMLWQLNWLPVELWKKFKVLVLTFKAQCGLGSTYLWDSLSWYVPQRTLNSVDQKNIHLASTRTRAFSSLASAWWNTLPSGIQALQYLMQFLKNCKIEMFYQAYGWCGGSSSGLASPCSALLCHACYFQFCSPLCLPICLGIN